MYFNEVSASLYAWDLADEGIERPLDNLQEMSGVNSVYLIALMHLEKRPLTDYFYPHNPVRKVYYPEDSRAYWLPDMSFYENTPIKPRTSDRDLLRGTDWLLGLIDAARKRGMKTGVELSHTFIDSERAAGEFAYAMQHDIYGNRISKLLCFNNPDAREYAVSLFVELVTRYDVDYIQTCMIPFSAGRSPGGRNQDAGRVIGTAMGGCFCQHCAKAAADDGLDFDKIFADMRALKPCLDSIRSSDYSEQSGNPERMEHKRRWLLSVRRAIGNEMPLLSAIGVRPKANPELIRQGVVISALCGADGITLGHYDGAPYSHLRAIREGMERGDVEMLPGLPD